MYIYFNVLVLIWGLCGF